MEAPPVKFIKLATKSQIIIQPCFHKVLNHMFPEVKTNDPSIFNILEPLLVIIITISMKVQHIFANENEMIDCFIDHRLDHLTIEIHDVVVEQVVPFAYQFDDTKILFVITKQHFQVQGQGAEFIPLRMDQVVVNGICKIYFAVFTLEKR